MATLTIKNLPDTLYVALKKTAAEHRRSLNSEAIVCLERSITSPEIDVNETLRRIRSLREKTTGHLMTDQEIAAARKEGRL